jgi:4-hydroxy-tetrahydrodipicolinate reductase
MKKYRVIVFGTGLVGQFALGAIIENPQFELAGVWVHNPEKVGRDAGEFVGTAKTGIRATNHIDELIARGADCVCYAAGGYSREKWTVEVQSRFLKAGINVVSSAMAGMNHPPTYAKQGLVEQIKDAAAKGKASFLSSGMDPGYSSDFAINLTQMSRSWSEIRVQEIYDYSTYTPTEAELILGGALGFGRPMDYLPPTFMPGTLAEVWGGPSVTLIADALGLKIDEIREVYWRHAADESFEVPCLGKIEKGTQEAIRFQIQGIINGQVAIVAEHITRLRAGSAPQWPKGDLGEGYYVRIEGDPLIKGHASFTGPNDDHQYGAILGTAMKLVNSIPGVCEARPGLLTAPLDMPPMVGGVYQTASRV